MEPSQDSKSKPSPAEYDPLDGITASSRFKNITFGYGNKMLGHYSNVRGDNHPGPGTYPIT